MDGDWGGIQSAPGGYGPVVVDWLVGHEQPTGLGVALTMLELGRHGCLELSWRDDDLMVRRLRAGRHDHEARVLDLLFHRVARSDDPVSCARVDEWAEMRPDESRRWRAHWADAATEHALAQLRGATAGTLLRRRRTRRDRDLVLDAWCAWAAEGAEWARVHRRDADALAEWAGALLLATAVGQGPALAARLARQLSPSEQAAVAGSWCPLPDGATLADGLEAVLTALPRVAPAPAVAPEG